MSAGRQGSLVQHFPSTEFTLSIVERAEDKFVPMALGDTVEISFLIGIRDKRLYVDPS
jgi:hypothetical protein